MSQHIVELEYKCHNDCGPWGADAACKKHKAKLTYHGTSHLYEINMPFSFSEKLLIEPGALQALVDLFEMINREENNLQTQSLEDASIKPR
jgi:hypothetical protein